MTMMERHAIVGSRGASPLMAIALLSLFGGATVEAQHGQHPTMPGMKFYLHVYFGDRSMQEPLDAQLDLESTSSPSKLDQRISLPAPLPSIAVLEYLPNAQLQQNAIATEDGEPAIQLAVEGPTQSYDRWLISGDSDRNRLTSFIGTWRMMGVKTETERAALWSQFETEMTRKPVLRARRTGADETMDLPATKGATLKLPDSSCTIRVLDFMPHYGLDDKSSAAVNQSAKQINPAAHVEIECAGISERRWIFAKFPTYSTGNSNALDVQVALDCPVESKRAVPSFTLVATANGVVELWSRADGKTSARSITTETRVAIAGSQYTFTIKTFLARARLDETYVAAGKGGQPAIRITMNSAPEDRQGKRHGEPNEFWLARDKPKTTLTQSGPLTLVFDSRNNANSEGH